MTHSITAGGDVLIFLDSNEDRETTKKIKLTRGQVRDPRDQRNYAEEDKRSFVIRGMTTRFTEEHVVGCFKAHNLKVTGTRFYNRTTNEPIGKMKIVCDSEEFLNNIPERINLGGYICTTERYRRHIRLIQCTKCQLFGHYRGQCNAIAPKCGKCSGAHSKSECTRTTLKCVNCAGPHESNSYQCQKAIDLREKLQNNINKKVDNAKDQLVRGNQQIQFTGNWGRGWSVSQDCKVQISAATTLTPDDLVMITRAIAATGRMIDMQKQLGLMTPDQWALITTRCFNYSFESDQCPIKMRNAILDYTL